MYIKSAEITNIRSIDNFKIEFENPAGWHVLIGDNGSGKSTIIRSLALALVGYEAEGLRADWRDWLNNQKNNGKILLGIILPEIYFQNLYGKIDNSIDLETEYHPGNVIFEFKRTDSNDNSSRIITHSSNTFFLFPTEGCFSVAYGPYRRFSGGDPELSKIFANQPRLGAHLSAFGENIALTEPIEWLMNLNYKTLEEKQKIKVDDLVNQLLALSDPTQKEILQEVKKLKDIYRNDLKKQASERIISDLIKLINSENFLPNNTKFEKISSDGVFFKDGNGNSIAVNQLSDGYRSILSLTFELTRQLIRVYGEEAVFKNIREDKMYIDLPGVVLIDEIDAHLHPTWQTKIGQWFLKYFPNLQFIVTTHSPLVCRAAEKGTIWKLAAPGSGEKSGQVMGIDRDRLIYGNILDAYGTEEFGIVDNIKAVHKKEELVRLSKKQLTGKISQEEEKKLHILRAIFSTDATIEL